MYKTYQEAFIKESIKEGTALNKELKSFLHYMYTSNEGPKKILSMLTNDKSTTK